MTLEQKYKEQYEIGFPIFQKLFQLKKDDFIKVMKDIFQDNKSVMEILENNPRVIKTLYDDEPEEMQIHLYGSVLINYTGVRFKPEHGSLEMILKFDKFFNVDVDSDASRILDISRSAIKNSLLGYSKTCNNKIFKYAVEL